MSATIFSTRIATIEDIPTIVAFSSGLFREDGGRHDPHMNVNWPQEESVTYFSAFIRRPQHICLLAEADGETAGYLAGYIEQPDSLRPVKSAKLESMYVKEGHRDRRIGERLVQDFLTWCQVNGVTVVSVTAYAANSGAIRFYQKYGFKPLGFSKQVEGCHRLSLMRKRVDQGAEPIFTTPIRSRKPSGASEQHRRGGNAGQKWLGIGQKVAAGGAMGA